VHNGGGGNPIPITDTDVLVGVGLEGKIKQCEEYGGEAGKAKVKTAFPARYKEGGGSSIRGNRSLEGPKDEEGLGGGGVL